MHLYFNIIAFHYVDGVFHESETDIFLYYFFQFVNYPNSFFSRNHEIAISN